MKCGADRPHRQVEVQRRPARPRTRNSQQQRPTIDLGPRGEDPTKQDEQTDPSLETLPSDNAGGGAGEAREWQRILTCHHDIMASGTTNGPATAGLLGGAEQVHRPSPGWTQRVGEALTVMANGQGAAACNCTERNALHGTWTVMIIRRDTDVSTLFAQTPGPSGVVACTWHCITRAGNGGYLAEATNH